MIYVSNAFSPQMVDPGHLPLVRLNQVVQGRPDLTNAVSAIGHADTAAILDLPFNRVNVTLQPGDTLYVAQLTGGRLPEGCTTLPDGFTFRWIRVRVLTPEQVIDSLPG